MTQLYVETRVIANLKGHLELEIILTNDTGENFTDFELMFNLSREVIPKSVQGATLSNQEGSFCQFKPTQSTLSRQSEWRFSFVSPTEKIDNLMEMPIGFHLITENETFPVTIKHHGLEQTAADNSNPLDLSVTPKHGVVPIPAHTHLQDRHFIVPEKLNVYVPSYLKQKINDKLRWFSQAVDIPLVLVNEPEAALLVITEDMTNPDFESFLVDSQVLAKNESYLLSIQQHKITVASQCESGMFYALVSLAQLIVQSPEQIQSQFITDFPRFEYRGFMLDCARHFHPINTIKSLLDQMAWLKLNQFHWHLCDDEGWRIEIDSFPKLTEIGAWRGLSLSLKPQFGSGPDTYGGYYSKADVREIVDYAQQRGIEIIPEIDVPGHARALLKALPDILGEPNDQSDYISIQQYRDNVLNPALPGTLPTLKAILAEVCELFPGRFIHLGADEVPDGVWEKSPSAIQWSQKNRRPIRDLQPYLLRELEVFLKSKNKKVIGWEEAIQSSEASEGLSQNATICGWRSSDSGWNAAKQGYPVIMTPAQFTYFDLAWNKNIDEFGVLWAGSLDLKTTYQFEPHGKELNEQQRSLIKGVQGQLWTEYVATEQQAQYLIYPRIFALAEVAWSAAENKDWNDFSGRLMFQLQRLTNMGIEYRNQASCTNPVPQAQAELVGES